MNLRCRKSGKKKAAELMMMMISFLPVDARGERARGEKKAVRSSKHANIMLRSVKRYMKPSMGEEAVSTTDVIFLSVVSDDVFLFYE